MVETLFNVRLDEEDLGLLESCAEREKLTKSDILRRALRAYAAGIGVTPEGKPRTKPKPKRK